MRRILKEVAPISQDQILNEVLTPLLRHQKALNDAQALNCMNVTNSYSRSAQYLRTSPQLNAISHLDCLNQQYNTPPDSPPAKRMLNGEI